tara:strand:+ start:510 stop:743 length:234 start_codon:yes stop_codon:yes gene_type:complete
MEFYEKRSKWYVITDTGSKHKFVKKTKALEFMENLKKRAPTIEQDESDTIEEEKSIAEKMKKAKATVTLDDLQGSYE